MNKHLETFIKNNYRDSVELLSVIERFLNPDKTLPRVFVLYSKERSGKTTLAKLLKAVNPNIKLANDVNTVKVRERVLYTNDYVTYDYVLESSKDIMTTKDFGKNFLSQVCELIIAPKVKKIENPNHWSDYQHTLLEISK